VKAAAIRYPEATADKWKYVRVNAFVLPCIGMPPTAPPIHGIADGFQVVYQTPADDTHTWRLDINTRRSQQVPQRGEQPETWPGLEGQYPVGPGGIKSANQSNGYLISREKQMTEVFSGIPFGPHTQDAVMTESMGSISDRENEHLGICDRQPAAMRQLLLKIVRDVMDGKDPPGIAYTPEDNRFNELDLVHATLPKDTPWTDRDLVMANAIEPSPYGY